MQDSVFENAAELLENVKKAAQASGRSFEDITVVAATKTVSAERINLLADCGITNIGENRVQELLDKYDKIDKDKFTFHFIGKLQTNKVKYIVDKVDMIHSVDSMKLAEEINKRCEKIGKRMKVLIEVNVGKEESKSGVMPEDVGELAQGIAALPFVELCGLMAIPPKPEYVRADDPDFDEKSQKNKEIANYFQIVKQISLDIYLKRVDNSNVHDYNMRILSMGMSQDYREAIVGGSTMIRPGRILFGERDGNVNTVK